MEWDDLTRGNVFLERKNLLILEKVNPCGQQYILLSTDSGPDSIITTYRHRLDLLAFAAGHLRLPVTMIGIPCSVSTCGFSLGEATRREACEWMCGIEGGKFALNVSRSAELEGLVRGSTLPSCKLDVRWSGFDEYVAALRSHYRHETQKTLSLGTELLVETLPHNMGFGDDLHQLYLNVYERSEFKLECLSADFFREFPGEIHVFRLTGKPVGFVKALESAGQLIFLFGGVDYEVNEEFRIYMNMLLFLLKEAISRKCTVVDFGQTAEEVKLKMGCRYSGRDIYAGHSRPTLHWVLRKCSGLLSYNPPEEKYNVFKS